MGQPTADANWRAIHGGLFLVALAASLLIPFVRQWPMHLVLPLALYLPFALLLPPLRRTFVWFRLGRITWRVLAAVVGVIVVSTTALVVFQLTTRPDLSQLHEVAPPWVLQHFVPFLIVFSIVNAVLEELVFRGVVYDSLESQLGITWALLVQAVVFGYGHMLGGYPPGILGAVLASIYGLMQGWLRIYSGGLIAPVLSHIFADATIALMIFRPE
jgi:membrane protease YdiL (CAAX protease family)